jgi:hypothetical protein
LPKQYITVRVEVDIYEEEGYPEHIESVLPVAVRTKDMSPELVQATLDFLRTDDDASFDFMWDLRALLGKAEKEQ